MSNKEVEEVLEELHNVRVENLNGKAKRLFDAIMSIADERDLLRVQVSSREIVANELQQRIDNAISYINGTKKDPNDLTDYSLELIEILEGE